MCASLLDAMLLGSLIPDLQGVCGLSYIAALRNRPRAACAPLVCYA